MNKCIELSGSWTPNIKKVVREYAIYRNTSCASPVILIKKEFKLGVYQI